MLSAVSRKLRYGASFQRGRTLFTHRFDSEYIHTVVMVRHGESAWNLENRFTGWCDVPLTQNGEADAIDAGALMGERGLKFDVAFTSNLERAWRTCALSLAAANQSGVETIRSSNLNERHYGALQGHHKDSPLLTEAFGEDALVEWRRSYDKAPPSLYDMDFVSRVGSDALIRSLKQLDDKYVDKRLLAQVLQQKRADGDEAKTSALLSSVFKANALHHRTHAPATESLKQCEERAFGYWKEVIAPRVLAGERVLIVAHANTIRALVKAVDRIDDDKIAHLKIPNGIPLVYTMDEHLRPISSGDEDLGFQANYLVSARNHAKMMTYERCVRKKLVALFEYLDEDGDGRITPDCLLNGLAKLHSDNAVGADGSNTLYALAAAAYGRENSILNQDEPLVIGNGSVYDLGIPSHQESRIQSKYCEFEIEELIRCVPDADEYGGVTLQAFLDSESTLLPTLTHLKLLQ